MTIEQIQEIIKI